MTTKDTPIVRTIDALGRIVLPQEMRKAMQITEQTPIAISFNLNEIVLKLHASSCFYCGNAKDLRKFHNTHLCIEC